MNRLVYQLTLVLGNGVKVINGWLTGLMPKLTGIGEIKVTTKHEWISIPIYWPQQNMLVQNESILWGNILLINVLH